MSDTAQNANQHAPADTHARASADAPVSGEEYVAQVSVSGLNLGQMNAAQVVQLQRTLGNRYMQRLAHNAQAKQHRRDTPPERPAPEIDSQSQDSTPGDHLIQRRLGFEFEENKWRAWKVENNKVRSARRKEELHTGTNYKLEGDDTPGDKLANIEFVTEPFGATPAGLTDYLATMTEVLDVVERITPLAGKPGPGDDNQVKAAKKPPAFTPANYVNQPQHGLSHADVALSAGTGAGLGQFKMQATSGISLENIPAVMENFGITPDEKKLKVLRQGGRNRDAVKQRMGIDDNKYDRLDSSLTRKEPARKIQANQALLGGSPTVARDALGRLGNELTYSLVQRAEINGHPQKLLGFLSILIMNIKGLGVAVNGPAKYRLPFLGRNNFVTLFGSLLDDTRAALASGNGRAFIAHVLDANNATSLVPGDNNKTADTPLVSGFPTLSDLTIGKWLTGILQGTDYLDPNTIETLMNGQPKKMGLFNKYSKKEKETSKDALESFATAPAMDTTEGANPMAILENRGIVGGAFATDFPMNEAITIGYNYLKFFVDLAAGTVDNNYDYPSYDVQRQQPPDDQQPDNPQPDNVQNDPGGEEVVIE